MRFIEDRHGNLISVAHIVRVRPGRTVEKLNATVAELIDDSEAEINYPIDVVKRMIADTIPAAPGWLFAVKVEAGQGVNGKEYETCALTQPIVGWALVDGDAQPVLLTNDVMLANATAVVAPSGQVISQEYMKEFISLEEWLRFDPKVDG